MNEKIGLHYLDSNSFDCARVQLWVDLEVIS